MRRFILPALLCLVLGVRPAAAITYEGVTMPDTYTADGQRLVLNGIGVRTLTVFAVKIYVAGLYLPQQSHDARAILTSPETKVIRLQYLHSGSKAEVEKEYRAGEAQNCGSGGCPESDKADFERMVAAAPGVAVGDTSTFIISQHGLRVLANDREIGNYPEQDLAYRILLGFIGDHPPSQALKSSLLGQPAS